MNDLEAAPADVWTVLAELVRHHRPKPPVNDEDIILRFRVLFAETWPLVPDEADDTARQKRSRVVTMFLRAALQELVAHIGPKRAAVTYVIGKEATRAIAEELEHRAQKQPTN